MSITIKEWCAIHYFISACNADPGAAFKTSALVKSAGINRNRLACIFKYLYHCRVGEYRQQRKFEHGRYLLAAGNNNIKQVAASCGYSSSQNFIAAFKQYHGITPNDFLQALKHNPYMGSCDTHLKKAVHFSNNYHLESA